MAKPHSLTAPPYVWRLDKGHISATFSPFEKPAGKWSREDPLSLTDRPQMRRAFSNGLNPSNVFLAEMTESWSVLKALACKDGRILPFLARVILHTPEFTAKKHWFLLGEIVVFSALLLPTINEVLMICDEKKKKFYWEPKTERRITTLTVCVDWLWLMWISYCEETSHSCFPNWIISIKNCSSWSRHIISIFVQSTLGTTS